MNKTERKKLNKPELLLPAGSLSVLKTAVMYGADAVYIGGEAFSLRAQADNFTISEIKEGVSFAHQMGAKVYVTANIFAHNTDLSGISVYFEELKDTGIDALIISDPGVFNIARRILPDIEIHISTQANNTNYETYSFWYETGAKRVVAARELSLDEIRQIREHIPPDMEIEAFVHGAMCISYSGRCLLSAYLTGRSANEGNCSHPCRWKYALEEETRPGEFMPVFENSRGTYILNSKDLCMIEHIPDLAASGINSFKIEGRMKSALYVASIGRAYRRAIDDYYENPSKYESNLDFYRAEILKCTFREYTTGFFYGRPSQAAQIYGESTYIKKWKYLGQITSDTKEINGQIYYGLVQKNKFSAGDEVEIIRPVRHGASVSEVCSGSFKADAGDRDISARVLDMRDSELNPILSCPHAGEHFYVNFGCSAPQYGIIRRKISDE